MTPEQFEAMRPHDLRDELGEAIWKVISTSEGYVKVSFSFVDTDGCTVMAATHYIYSEFANHMLFQCLALARESIGIEYEFHYRAKRVRGDNGHLVVGEKVKETR